MYCASKYVIFILCARPQFIPADLDVTFRIMINISIMVRVICKYNVGTIYII